VDPVPDPLHPRKSGSAGIELGTYGPVAKNSLLDHRGGSNNTTYMKCNLDFREVV
jgi:hypothetical protein